MGSRAFSLSAGGAKFKIRTYLSSHSAASFPGKIFFLSRYPATAEYETLNNFLEKKVKNFYRLPFAKNKTAENDGENCLENFLFSLNQDLQDFLREKKFSPDFSSWQALIGLYQKKGEKLIVHFSQTQGIEQMVVYPEKENEYGLAQIKDENEETPCLFKIFSQIISGELDKDYTLFLCPSEILNFTSSESLIDLAARGSAEYISQQLKNFLPAAAEKMALGGIIIKNCPEKPLPPEKEERSLPRLPRKKFSLPSFSLPKFKPLAKKKNPLPQIEEKTEKTPLPAEEKIEPPKEKETIKNQSEKKEEPQKTTAEKFPPQPIKPKKKALSWPLTKKLLFLAFLILIFLLGQNLVFSWQKKKEKEQYQHYQKLLTQIEDKENQLEASLIYNNKTQATALLLNLQKLINQLPANSPQQKAKLIALKEKLEKLSFKAKNIEKISPLLLLNFSNITKSPVTALACGKGKVFLVTQKNNFYALDIPSLKLNKINSSPLKFSSPLALLDEGKTLIALEKNNTFLQINLAARTVQPLNLTFPSPKTKIISAFLYQKKLYCLDSQNQQILKYSLRSQPPIFRGTWNQNPLSSQAKSLAIDGSIYVLNLDGSIDKFFKGYKEKFSFSNENNLLDQPVKIWTNYGFPYLYVLDKAGHKIAAIDKKGKLVKQFFSEKFSPLQDFCVGDKGKAIYVLANDKLYKFSPSF